MLYLAFIFHMHQPYYKDLLTQEIDLPWARLHGVKDYLDMVELLEEYPKIYQTFNLVPSLLEQLEDYTKHSLKDKFQDLSLKPAAQLSREEQSFILENFFSINIDNVISTHPRYYQLFLKRRDKKDFSAQDYLDLQVWFNLAWIDPYFRERSQELKNLINKGRFFYEEEKHIVLAKQLSILEEIIPVYKKFMESNQIEVTISPYYHPILPLIYNTNIAKEANTKTALPKLKFCYPEDCKAQINQAVDFYKIRFGNSPLGMWPSEESVSEHILPFIIQSGIKWLVTDEAILFKSLKKKRRDCLLLYQPYLLRRKEGDLNIIFRDRNLSDLIGFVYHSWKTETAVKDFIQHLENISELSKDRNILVTIAMDGENAWEYYPNDGRDFLRLLYDRLSDSKAIKTTTVREYLKSFPVYSEIRYLAPGSWINGDFAKWIGHPLKVKAWEYLAKAREELERVKGQGLRVKLDLAWKQMYICEGSDWFWWFGENHSDFDRLFRTHLANFYRLIEKDIPSYLKKPL